MAGSDAGVDQNHIRLQTMSSQKTKQERSVRYGNIIDSISVLDPFDMSSAKEKCDDRPFFVTRVVNELVKDGWLVKESTKRKGEEIYRWNGGRGKFNGQVWIENRVNGVRIAATPEKERPRERLIYCGAKALTDSELLAILIRSGRPGESAIMGLSLIHI